MKLLLLMLFLTSSAFAQSKPELSLAPYRSAAHQAFTEEMVRADQPLCPNLVALVDYGPCLNAALKLSESHLATYRSALKSSMVARQTLLGASTLEHFQSSEQLWDLYSQSEIKAAGDMAEGPELVGSAEGEARINLIRSHMRMLDRIYYTLLHDDCGACLVDH